MVCSMAQESQEPSEIEEFEKSGARGGPLVVSSLGIPLKFWFGNLGRFVLRISAAP